MSGTTCKPFSGSDLDFIIIIIINNFPLKPQRASFPELSNWERKILQIQYRSQLFNCFVSSGVGEAHLRIVVVWVGENDLVAN